jgi:hypothetical protein
VATPETLLASAGLLGISPEAAIAVMKTMAARILDTWRQRFESLGAEPENLDKLEPAFKIARMVVDHEFKVLPAPARRGRYRPA